MPEFLRVLFETGLLQSALLGGILASIACGVIGSYVVSRRITYIADGISHSVLGGIGIAGFLMVTQGWVWLHPMYGGIVAAVLSAFVIGYVSLSAREREDTVITAIWVVGMAVGILFLHWTPGYAVDPMSYLFGDILMISSKELWLIVIADVLVLVTVTVCWKPFLAVCFDSEFARLRGVRSSFYYLLLLVLTAVTVVSLVFVVGVVLMLALLALPAAAAGRLVKTLWQMMVLGVLFSAGIIVLGLVLSTSLNVPSGAAIAALAGAFYLAVALFARLKAGRGS